MSDDLLNEIEVINSIYGDGTLSSTSEAGIFVLYLARQATSLRIRFPTDYPSSPPTILGSQSSGDRTRKGEAAHVVNVVRDILGSLYKPGEVCLFDVIEEVNNALPNEADQHGSVDDIDQPDTESFLHSTDRNVLAPRIESEPPWALSDVVTELKSVFVARAAPVLSPDQARSYLQHLLDNDKRVRTATHNITAWRIKGENGVTFQDCDDDGETAAGGRVLHLMQLMDVWDIMVVVTRWYGGQQLGPKRFSIINTVARDAVAKAGMVKGDFASKKKGKR